MTLLFKYQLITKKVYYSELAFAKSTIPKYSLVYGLFLEVSEVKGDVTSVGKLSEGWYSQAVKLFSFQPKYSIKI